MLGWARNFPRTSVQSLCRRNKKTIDKNVVAMVNALSGPSKLLAASELETSIREIRLGNAPEADEEPARSQRPSAPTSSSRSVPHPNNGG